MRSKDVTPPAAAPAGPAVTTHRPGSGQPAATGNEPDRERPRRRTFEEQHKKQSVYLGEPVYEQLRRLAFEERRKMHDYLIEGLDSVFRDRGLPSIAELEKEGA
jgi:hypothetical protein